MEATAPVHAYVKGEVDLRGFLLMAAAAYDFRFRDGKPENPRVFVPETTHAEALALAKENLERVNAMTTKEWRFAYESNKVLHDVRQEEAARQSAALAELREQLKALPSLPWDEKTHEFPLTCLNQAANARPSKPCAFPPFDAWIKEQKEDAEWDVKYETEESAKEAERNERSAAWFEALYGYIDAVAPAEEAL